MNNLIICMLAPHNLARFEGYHVVVAEGRTYATPPSHTNKNLQFT